MTQEAPIHVSNVMVVDPDGKPTRVGYRHRRERPEGPHRAYAPVRICDDDGYRTKTLPRLKERYRDEIAAAAAGAVQATATRCRSRGLVKIVVNMGVGEAARDAKLIDGAVRDLDHDHRPEAAGPPGDQVHRAVQAARGHADRREGHPARRPDVGVPGPAAVDRAAAYPRLPRSGRAQARRPRQLHVRSDRAVGVPRDRPGPHRPAAGHGHHGGHHRHAPTTRAGRCSSSSASRSRRRTDRWRRRR